MVLIRKLLTEASSVFKYRAPRNFMYLIHSVHLTVLTAGNNRVIVIDELAEDEVTTLSVGRSSGIIFVGETDIAGLLPDITFSVPLPSKFISIGRELATTFSAFIIIDYELIEASKTELIIEWFRKGR